MTAAKPLWTPSRRTYRPESPSISRLPFITKQAGPYRMWDVQPTEDYDAACRIGAEFAAHFAQFIRDDPELAGQNVLGQIASEIDFSDEGRKGYWVGFFTHIEYQLRAFAKTKEPFAYLDKIRENYPPDE